MPELPEVESFRKYIEDTSLHQKIREVKCSTPKMLWNTTAKELENILEDNVLEATSRHGKFLFVKLQHHGFLLLHFGMTGRLYYGTTDPKHPRAFVLMINFANGKTLLFSDSRMLGKIALVKDVEQFILDKGYGPDALSISQKDFLTLFQPKKVAIKTLLMNQKIVAGVGNEFSDAILFQCKIHPLSIAKALSEPQLELVFKTMKKILTEAVHVNADRKKLDHYFLLNHRKAGLPCVRCEGKTELETIGGRSSYFCPSCQVVYK